MLLTSLFLYLLLITFGLVYYTVHRTFSYWKIRGWPHDTPHWIFGNLKDFGKTKHYLHIYRELYSKFKSAGPVFGFYLYFQPVAFITDLDLVQKILIKDFSNFMDRGIYFNEHGDPISAHLFALDGKKWRVLRTKLSSAFTSLKMKNLFPIVVDVADRFSDVYNKLLEKD